MGHRRKWKWCGVAAGLAMLAVAMVPGPIKAGWVDPSTQADAYTVRSNKDGEEYHLVMSDEFDVENRTFADGEDPTWTAMDHSDDSRGAVGEGALIYYNHSYVTTTNGKLNITTTSELTHWKGFNPYKRKYEIFEKQFRGGMINSWNKFCFSGGIVEISVKLPGKHDVGGLWPAFWLMGNLGRAIYEHSTNLMWPWSYDACDRKLQRAQEISACGVTRHWDLHAKMGRGATEIDVLEVMPGPAPLTKPPPNTIVPPYLSTTLQISPGVKTNRPFPGKAPQPGQKWYKNLLYGPQTQMNQYFYGTLLDKTQKDEPTGRSIKQVYQADALSALTGLNRDYFDDYHTYRLEWMPGEDGYVAWYLDNQFLYEVSAESLAETTGAQIPVEPAYLILNTAVSTTWGFPQMCPEGCACNCFDCTKAECRCGLPFGFCDALPAHMLVDWVRVYQLRNDSRHFTGCDHPRFPTRKYIAAHKFRYVRDTEDKPLQKLQKGWGFCKEDNDCAPGGTCNMRKRSCMCSEGWVGPTCKQPDYFDPNDSHTPYDLPILPVHMPPALVMVGTVLLAGLITAAFSIGRTKAKNRPSARNADAIANTASNTHLPIN